jgi:hypothetical protein
MRNDEHLAIKLRKQKKSYNKISKELNVSKSTLAYWFKDKDWSQKIKKELTKNALYVAKKRLRLINKSRKEKWDKWHKKCRKQARKDFIHLKKDPLFLAGLMLYWGEGDSKIENGLVRLSNTDPKMIKIVSLFLQKKCEIPKEKIKISLILYPDLNENKCKDLWSKSSGISKNNFLKTQIIYGKHPTKRLSFGICNIYVSSRELKEKILVWIKLYKQELTRV